MQTRLVDTLMRFDYPQTLFRNKRKAPGAADKDWGPWKWNLQSSARILCAIAVSCLPLSAAENRTATTAHPGQSGGRLVVAQRSEPRTLNPIAALDAGSQEVISLIADGLVDIDHESLRPVLALAKSLAASPDRRHYTVQLRQGVRFSDGVPFDADDVIFTFAVHEDESTHSPQHDFLMVGGQPISVTKLNTYTVRLDFAAPYSAADGMLAGIGILPRHLLEKSFHEHRLAEEWGLTTPPAHIAGLGPFVVKEYVPGERLVLARNPYYWKTDARQVRLPYLDEIAFLFTSSENAQVLRFMSGEADLVEGLSPQNFFALKADQDRRGLQLYDSGPGLEFTFLLFNQNELSGKNLSSIQRKQAWFRDVAFRQAISAAVDRDAIARLVYRGMAAPIWTQVTAGNKPWINDKVSHDPRSVSRARDLLRAAGFSWNSAQRLLDPSGNEVSFSILTSAGNAQREKISALIQDDLKQIGIPVSVVSLEFRAMMDRILSTYDYEAAVLTLSGSTDPNAEMSVWTLNGSTHLWNLNGRERDNWESEIDRLMRRQLVARSFEERKHLYDRVQDLVATNLPVICLASPHVLVAASGRVRNLDPSILKPYALWNAGELYLERPGDHQ